MADSRGGHSCTEYVGIEMGRGFSEAHLRSCLHAQIKISGEYHFLWMEV